MISNFFYLSPEIIIDKNENNEKSDVYSFSIIAYQILTNELPFDKIPKHHEFTKKMFEGSIHPKIIQPIPKMYKDLLEKCFSFEQSERPSFIDIVSYLSKDQQFITDEIDKTELERYKDLFKQH